MCTYSGPDIMNMTLNIMKRLKSRSKAKKETQKHKCM